MSYAAGASLQMAIFARLQAAAGLAGVMVCDGAPLPPVPERYVLIGPEEVTDASDRSGGGAEHRVMVSVISDADGFLSAKEMAAEVDTALDAASLPLSEGRVVSVRFLRAVARRLDGGQMRRIDLSYRIRIEF
jgi:hypothetical protein